MSNFIPIVSILASFSIPILAIYYLFRIKPSLLTVVIILIIVQSAGVVLMIFKYVDYYDFAYGKEMFETGFYASILFALIIAYQNLKIKKSILLYVIATTLVIESVLYFSHNENIIYGTILNLLLVVLIGIIKIKREMVNTEIDKVLNIYLLIGIFSLIVNAIA